jgi:predicted metal-dependent HD superfamily phosphohydrolase
MALPDQVERDWVSLWKRVAARGEPLPALNDLVARYTESHRGYHSLAHVLDCLREFNTVRRLAQNPDAIELALWFHDAIYNPRAADNEEQSARLAEQVLTAANLTEPFIRDVRELILATRHQSIPESADARLLVDIDLSVLGQSAERFDAYEAGVRKEYKWVPGPLFAMKRSAILKSFLDRAAIYATPWFREKYEAAARANLARSVRQLS